MEVTLSRTVAVPDDFNPDDLFAKEYEQVLAEKVDPLDCDAPAFAVDAVTPATDESGFIDLDWSTRTVPRSDSTVALPRTATLIPTVTDP